LSLDSDEVKSSFVILDHNLNIAASVAEQVTKKYGNDGLVECVRTEADLKSKLEEFRDHSTTVIVNASFKPFPNADPLTFSGIERVIKKALRVTWFSRYPIIAYADMSELEMAQLTIGQIFKATCSHKYFDIRRLIESGDSSLKEIIASVTPVPSDADLRTILHEFCHSQLCERLASLKHDLKNHKLDSPAGRADLLASFHYLRRAVSGELINLPLIEDGIRIVTNFREEKRSQAEARLRTIRLDMESVVCILKRRRDA
jgi:hypothetical protein